MNPAYIKTFDIKQPNSETILVSSTTPPAQTETSMKLARELFGDGPLFSHGTSGGLSFNPPSSVKVLEKFKF